MSGYLGIDTSNYTTSACIYDDQTGGVIARRQLLPVKEGERGVRQSDAVFHHVNQLPALFSDMMAEYPGEIAAVGASSSPREAEGSYMPCFLVSEGAGKMLSAALRVPFYTFSHQQGHIAAALYSIDRLDLIDKPHIAFHVSGGTTEALAVNYDGGFLSARIIGRTLDLNAGQLIDRIGVLMGLRFPCGRELEALAVNASGHIPARATLKGFDCCLSGGENQAKKLLDDGHSREDVARFTLDFVYEAIGGMCRRITAEYPGVPIVFAGGVMSNAIIRSRLKAEFDCLFSKPEFSTDNAAGIAVMTYLKEQHAK